jgi:hypothetical protein
MNLPWRGGFLFLLLALQDPAPARPDLVAKYAAILDQGPDARRDLAARALLSLGRPGYEALKRALAAKPDLAKVVIAPGDAPPPTAWVRIEFNESELWQSLDSTDPAAAAGAARRLRHLYTPPDPAPPGLPSTRLAEELSRKRDFDFIDRSLIDFLKGEPISWILMSPRDERITLRMKEVTLSDVFRIALAKFAAVPVGDLLILIPPDRIASAEPGTAVWAPSDLAPRIETALDALARGDEAPINGLTGVGVYHALKRAKHVAKAEEVRKQLEQRVFFIDAPGDDGAPVTLSPGTTAAATVAAFEKAAGLKIEIGDPARLEGSTPAFRFQNVPAKLAARALAFRLNRIP